MVRKRSRKYDSDNSDSDVDWDPTVESKGPAAKKYSLRERKSAPSFCEFDYLALEEDDESRKLSSEDDDFEVEAEVEPMRPFYEHSEPEESEEAQCSGGLIDFEDIIRADIVVNKNKIDYDNIIQKTEIKLTQAPKVEPQAPKRRGRKPKNWALMNEVKTEVKDEIKEEIQDSDNCTLEPKTEPAEADESEVKNESIEGVINDASLPNGDCVTSEEGSREILASSTIQEEQPTCSTVRSESPIQQAKTNETSKADSNIEMSKDNSPKSDNRSDDDDIIALDDKADQPVIVLDE